MDTVHVAALVGSLREASYTRLACEHLLATADAHDHVETDLIDLQAFDLPPYDSDRDSPGDSAELLNRVDRADAVLLATPNYHGSYSGVLKNALDYCGRDEFGGKTVGLVAIAGGAYSSSPLDHLRVVARTIDAWVTPRQVAIQNASARFEDGELTDEAHADRLDALAEQLVAYADLDPDERVAAE